MPGKQYVESNEFRGGCIPAPMSKEQQDFFKSLKQRNHTCVEYMSYHNPPTIKWCEKEPCVNKQTSFFRRLIDRFFY